jgi:hypothetical protein
MEDQTTPPAEANEAKAPEVQSIAPTKPLKSMKATNREVTTTLAGGFVREGKVYDKVILSALTAGDRQVFGDAKLQKNGGKMITKLLASKIVEVPGFGQVSTMDVRETLSMDRDQMIMDLRNATVGDKPFVEKFTCQECGVEDNHVEFPVEEVTDTFLKMPEAERLNIEGGKCVFKVDLPDYGFTATFAQPDGVHQEYISPKAQGKASNAFQLELEVLAKLCIDWNGEGRIGVPYLQDLDIEFLDELQVAFASKSYGYDTSPEGNCYNCGHGNPVRVSALDFLFDGWTQTRTQKRTRTQSSE